MRNTEKYQITKSIVMSVDEFKELIEKLTNGIMTIEFNHFMLTDLAYKNDLCWPKGIGETLSEYFDVAEVTSVHTENPPTLNIDPYADVHICYREK